MGYFNQLFGMENSCVLITGASSGIGMHLAKVVAKAGCVKIGLLARRKDRLDALKAELEREFPGVTVAVMAFDVKNFNEYGKVYDYMEKSLGSVVSVLVNNAGVSNLKGAMKVTTELYDQIMDINVKACFFMATEAGKRMRKAGVKGSIVNVSSLAAVMTINGEALYSTSKAALMHLTKNLQSEWINYGIRVNNLHPGFFRTEINEHVFSTEVGDKLTQHLGLGRLGSLSELDGAFLLMATDAGSFMLGSSVFVDGGEMCLSRL